MMPNWTREQYIKLIQEYKPICDMKSLDTLVNEIMVADQGEKRIVIDTWRDLPDEMIEKLCDLCAEESNHFYRRYA